MNRAARPLLTPGLLLALALILASVAPAVSSQPPRGPNREPAPLPEKLRDTGLFAAGSSSEIRSEVLAFSPQYPLWSDGAKKQRWLYLPPGKSIDASQPDAWDFPIGTRLWKEFSHGGPVETRLIERLADGSWRYATYIWDQAGTDAVLAPAAGATLNIAGGGRYAIPSQDDCRACHEAAAVPVLGFSALQLSPDRDALAPHTEPARPEQVDLPQLVRRGWLRNLPASFLANPPRIAAETETGRAALGYLHANCGHCHNSAGPLAALDLSLAQLTGAGRANVGGQLDSLIGPTSRFRAQGLDQRIVPGQAQASVLAMRMRSRNPLTQMPPLGSQVADEEGIALIERWINHDLKTQQELPQ